MLHRDIKPQNLILREGTQQIVLIDFGIAREFTPGFTQTHTHLVSEGYAPIEQYFPQAKRSSATDIYGLAATLYTLLTGKVPIAAPLRDRSPLPELRQLLPGVSASVNEAVMRGMAMEPLHRPATVEAWLALLSCTETNSPVVPNVGSTSQVATVAVSPAYHAVHPRSIQGSTVMIASPAQKGTSQSRWWLPGVLILGALIPLVLGYSWWQSQTSLPTDQPKTTDTFTPLESPAVAPAAPLENSTQPSEVIPPSDAPAALEPFSTEAIDSEATSAPASLDTPTSDRSTGENINPAPPQRKQAREAQRREEEQAREEEKRRKGRAKEEGRGRGND